MARPRTLPDPNELRILLLTESQAEIARRYGVTRAAVSKAARTYNLDSGRVSYDEFIPWRAKVEHQRDYAVRMLRLYGRRQMGLPLDDRDVRYLDRWLEELRRLEAVVDYDPERGFYYTRRREGIDTGLIREPEWRLSQDDTAARVNRLLREAAARSRPT